MINHFQFDHRWVGPHGIGRFASELARRIDLTPLAVGGSPTAASDFLRLSLALWKTRGIVFSPGFNAPLCGLDRYIFTIHDLNHIDIGANPAKHLYYRLVMKRACQKAARVLTVSEFSRWRIIAWSGVPPQKVVNVGNGVSAVFRPDGERFSLGNSYLLCIGNRKPHKNEARAIEGFAQAGLDPSICLAFNGQASRELLTVACRSGVERRVIFLGSLDDSTLAAVYRGALGLVFPSLYEGFGFPVIEAMASGIPVLTANVTALPEVAGEAALLVNPLSIQEIARGTHRLVNDHALRTALTAAGLLRARELTWESVAHKVKTVLADVQRSPTSMPAEKK